MTSIETPDSVIDRYYAWLKSRTSWRDVNGWAELTTPYLDRHNDYIQIYLRAESDGWKLTDDGYTLADLEQSGCAISSPRRIGLLQETLNGYGVKVENQALRIDATSDNLPLKKHSLLQAILAVNDLFYVAQKNVTSFFFEDVSSWLDEANIRYTPRVTFVGRSRYPNQFDFVIPKSQSAPERMLRIVNNPNKETAQNVVFGWVDTKGVRPAGAVAFAVLNDRSRNVGGSVMDALRSYDITPIPWSQREAFRSGLAA